MWRQAQAHDLLTVGDFLEHHFGREVRGLAALSIWLGSFFILCGQLKGAALVLHSATGLSLGMGAFLGTVATVAYFAMGGLKSAAWVNRVQLVVILVGFSVAAPIGGPTGRRTVRVGRRVQFLVRRKAWAGSRCCSWRRRFSCHRACCRKRSARRARRR